MQEQKPVMNQAEDSDLRGHGTAALENMHKVLIEVLRQREEEMVRYLAILGPALGGFIWLLYTGSNNLPVFIVGTMGVLLLLLLGAGYSLALGYNYRYIILELAKLETVLQIRDVMLLGWPRTPKEFLDRYKFWGLPWCTPPEVIKVFWSAFIVGITGVTIAAASYKPETTVLTFVVPTGAICLFVALVYWPIRYGVKLRKHVREEPESWSRIAGTGRPHGGEGK